MPETLARPSDCSNFKLRQLARRVSHYYDAELAKDRPPPRAGKPRAVAVKPSQRALKGLARARKAGVFA